MIPKLFKYVLMAISSICLWLGIINCQVAKESIRSDHVEQKSHKQIDALKKYAKRFVVMPGQVTLLEFPYFGPFKDEALVCDTIKIPYFSLPSQGLARAYLARSYFDGARKFACEFYFVDSLGKPQKQVIGQLLAKDYQYPKEVLQVDHKKVVLSKKDLQRVEQEKKLLDDIYQKQADSILFDESFAVPLLSKVTSIFGTKRIFNKAVTTQHLGTDYRAQIGTDIQSSNKGKVVFTGDLFFGGKTVIVSHGLGIFTTYSHLSKFNVDVGQEVNKGTLLGLSGMTGRVSGPHLHWGVKVHGHWVDGNSLVDASIKNYAYGAQSEN